MKYGVNTMVWTTRVGEQQQPLLEKIKSWGFDGVELFVSPDEPADVRGIARALERLGLEPAACSVVPPQFNIISSDVTVRRRGVEFVIRCVERTAEMGGKVICGPLYAGLGVMVGRGRTDQEWKWAVDALQKVATATEKLGVRICVEPLNRFETYFLNTQDDGAQFVRDVGAEKVRLHFDTFHANIEEKNPAVSLRRIAKELGHVHISENDRGIPGTGHVDWKGVVEVLREIGYDDWLTIESFAQPEPELAAAAAIWRDVATSGDELARSGLEFIKRIASQAQPS